jgi:hypothetical protein
MHILIRENGGVRRKWKRIKKENLEEEEKENR